VGLQATKVSKYSEWSNSSTESTASHGSSSTLPRMGSHASTEQAEDLEMLKRDKKARPSSMLDASEPSTNSLRKNQSSEDLLRDAQTAGKGPVKVPPPVPSKPKQVTLPPGGPPGQHIYGKPTLNTGTFPGKARPSNQHQAPVATHRGHAPISASQSHTLPLPAKQETPPAAKVRPFTPELPVAKDPTSQAFHKPQTLDTSSIYSMYTKKPTPGTFQAPLQGTLTRTQPRVYGKPVIPGGAPQSTYPDNPYLERSGGPETTEVDHAGGSGSSSAPSGQEGQETERIPRPLSPTKLLPFISNPYRHQSDVELEALRKKLYHAPRPLKKRSSITEPEGPAGPNIQKLLYQKTTLAAMETVISAPFYQPHPAEGGEQDEGKSGSLPMAEPLPHRLTPPSPGTCPSWASRTRPLPMTLAKRT
ncbi:hypothetical protein AGOR_G00099860, partial [Albula goreensis]